MDHYLIIDGNYFAQRVLGQLNQVKAGQTKTNNLVTDLECSIFKQELYRSLENIYGYFNNEKFNLIDNIIFCADHGSWRKKIPGFKPVWFDTVHGSEPVPMEYKEQRKAKKEESPINYDNFYRIFSEFVDEITQMGVITFSIPGCEGDDCIALIKDKFDQDKQKMGIMFGTDGDLEQLVSDNFIYFKNVRSSSAPNGEIVLNAYLYDVFFRDVKFLFADNSKMFWFNSLLDVQIGSYTKAKRELNRGLRIAQAQKIVFEKCVCGDAKDNIFSLASWLSSTGTRKYSISKKQLVDKLLREMGFRVLTDNVAEDIMDNVVLSTHMCRTVLELFLPQMLNDENTSKVLEHFHHNMQMNSLQRKFIPRELCETFDKQYTEKLSEFKKFPLEQIQEYLNQSNFNDSIYADSLADILD